MKKFKIETELIQIAGACEANCNEITFVNKSALGVVVQIDGYDMAAGDTRTDTGNFDEQNTSRYVITASSASFRLFVLRKIYK